MPTRKLLRDGTTVGSCGYVLLFGGICGAGIWSEVEDEKVYLTRQLAYSRNFGLESEALQYQLLRIRLTPRKGR